MAINRSYSNKKTDDFKYEVLEECGACTARANGDVVKLRYISWNGRDPKYDLRVWSTSEDGESERCGKGIGLNGEELEEIYDIIGKLMEEP